MVHSSCGWAPVYLLDKIDKEENQNNSVHITCCGINLFFVLAKFRQKEKLKIWKMKWFQRVSIAKIKGKKTPVSYIWFSVCSHKHRIFILNICTSYPVPKDDCHFCYEGSPLRLHKKFLQKKTLVGISFMHIAPDSSWTQILWNGHFPLKPFLDVLVFR